MKLSNRSARLPYGPPNLPSWIQALRICLWILKPLEVIDARAKRYGDDFRVTPLNIKPTLLYFSTPEALEAVFTAPDDQLAVGSGNRLLQPLLGNNGIVLLEGKAHQRQRQLLMPPFHGDRMRSYGELIQRLTEQTLETWRPGEPFTVRAQMQSISLRVILATVFGVNEKSGYERLESLLKEVLDTFTSPVMVLMLFFSKLQKDYGAWSPWGRFLRLRRQIDQLVYREIDERRHRQAGATDILSLLLAARDESGQGLTDDELRDELITLLFAGHETTASALSWALYWVHVLPDIQHKLFDEITACPADPDPMTIARLPYLSAVCQETLRLYPVAINAFPRIVRRPTQLLNYDLEPDTIIIPSVYRAHRRPQVYEDPDQFKPERFLGHQFSPYEYLPFGGGDRRCIGAAFALFEMKLVLFTVLTQTKLTLVSKRIRPVRRGFTMAPSNQLQMIPTPLY